MSPRYSARQELINRVTGNIISQLLITQHVLRHMLDGNAGGQIVNITSNASHEVPPAPVGRGGWPLAYSVTKAGFHRMADMLAVEYGDRGIRGSTSILASSRRRDWSPPGTRSSSHSLNHPG